MSAPTDQPVPEPAEQKPCSAALVWQGVGAGYLLACLLGLAAGMWPSSLLYPKTGQWPLPLPTLQTLAVGQAAFFLLLYPFALVLRCERQRDIGQIGRRPLAIWRLAAETLFLLFVVTAPFYLVAAYLGDAVTRDVVRAAISVACLIPLSWACGVWMCRGGAWAAIGALITLLAAMGLPAALYVSKEFLGDWGAGPLWDLTPATFIWQNSAPRMESLLPDPFWALLTWPGLAVVMVLIGMLRLPNRQRD